MRDQRRNMDSQLQGCPTDQLVGKPTHRQKIIQIKTAGRQARGTAEGVEEYSFTFI